MEKTKIGILGCGAIGEGVALFIDKQLRVKTIIAGICDQEEEKAQSLKNKLKAKPIIYDLEGLTRECDFIIETASQAAAKDLLKKSVLYGKDVLILSVGALISDSAILQKAESKGIKIYIPSGAICGVDGVGALSLGNIKKISLTTSKPPKGLIGANYLIQNKIDINNIKSEKIVFKGSVKEAIKYFPQNINVAAALFLASGSYCKGKEKNIEVCIKADPKIKNNIHHIEIEAEETKISINIENRPSPTNPKTSALAILSTQNLLRKIFSSFKIGS